MIIHKLQLGELRSNCYIVETAPHQCIAVDIGGDSRLLLNFLKMKQLKLSKILLTHGHFDHIGGVQDMVGATGAEVYIHEDDAHMLESASASLASSMSYNSFVPVTSYISINENAVVSDGDYSFRVLHTPGHSMGSVCYVCEDVIFSGDTLFCCSIGRTDFPGSNHEMMMASLKLLRELDGDFRVLPGHNDSTTLDYERKSNPFMRNL